MPDIKIYLRTEDIDKWNAIEKKSEWLHNRLAEPLPVIIPNSDGTTVITGHSMASINEAAESFIPRPPDPDTGYPCCTKAKPCKHWEYDGLNGQWVNSLTGKTREVA